MYKNSKLEQTINDKKNESLVDLSGQNLTDNDMEIVGYYLLRNNNVSNVLCLVFILKEKRREEF
jgi:hypothetical protein